MARKIHEIKIELLNGGMIKRASVCLPNRGKPISLEAEHNLSSGELKFERRVILWNTRSCMSGIQLDEVPEEYKHIMDAVVKAAQMTDKEINEAKAVRKRACQRFTELFG